MIQGVEIPESMLVEECIYCGHLDRKELANLYVANYSLSCPGCAGHTKDYASLREAVKAWNEGLICEGEYEDIDEHIGCFSYPECELNHNGCVVRNGSYAEPFGHRD